MREEFDLLTHGRAEWFPRVGDCVGNDREVVQVYSNHGNDGDTFLLVDMAEDPRDRLLALAMGKNRNERMRSVRPGLLV